MSDKTLGEVAFDAAKQCPALMLDTLAPWEQQRPDVREAWQAAAKAVAKCRPCPRCGKPSTPGGIMSLDSLPPKLTAEFVCASGHSWFMGWEGE